MKTTLFVVSIALLACAFAQDCNNPLLAAFNLTGLDQPQTVQGLNYCSNLQNGQSCCSSDTVNQFQSLLQDLVNSLEDEAGSRDQVLVGFRNNLLDRYQDAVSDLTDNDDQLTRLTNSNAAVGNEVRSEWSRFSNITDLLSDLDDDDLNDSDQNDDTDDENDFFVYLQNLQVARSTCLEKILDVQSSLWCLACDPNWASQGVNSNGTVTVSQQLADDITSSCYNYTVWSQRFNPLLIANQTYQRVQNLNNYLRNYGNDNSVLQSANVSNDVYSPTNANEQTVVLPRNCSNTTCNWQTILLFSSGSINQSIAANGAGWLGGANALLPNIIQGNVINSSAVPVSVNDLISNASAINLVVESSNNNQTAWSPANNISGLPVAVTGDPAQVSGLQDNALPTGVTGAIGGGLVGAGAGAAVGNNNNNNNNTDNDGIDTDNTDNDGINTDANDVTDNDGINTDANDPTDNDNNNDRTDNNNTDNDDNNNDTDNN